MKGPSRRDILASGGALAALAACGRGGEGAPEALRVALATAPDSLNPLRGTFAAAALFYKQLHAPLTEYSPGGGLAPGLARSWRSEDGQSWVFRLNPDLAWSDGTPLTAEDIVYTVRRIADPQTSPGTLGDFFAVQRAREALAGDADPADIGVEAPDARTVIFKLNQPVGLFPTFMREFYPIPQHGVARHGADWTKAENWIGAGPYRLAARSADRFSLERNPRFHGVESVAIARIEVSIEQSAERRARAFEEGRFDLAEEPPPGELAAYEAKERWSKVRTELQEAEQKQTEADRSRREAEAKAASAREALAETSADLRAAKARLDEVLGEASLTIEEAREHLARLLAGGTPLRCLRPGQPPDRSAALRPPSPATRSAA